MTKGGAEGALTGGLSSREPCRNDRGGRSACGQRLRRRRRRRLTPSQHQKNAAPEGAALTAWTARGARQAGFCLRLEAGSALAERSEASPALSHPRAICATRRLFWQ